MQLNVMQPVDEQDSSADQSLWTQGASAWGSKAHASEDTGDVAMAKIGSVDADGGLHAIMNESVRSVDVALQNPNFQDHEMFSWLHLSIDDILEKGFDPELFRELPGSTVQIVKHSFDQLGLQPEPISLPINASETLVNDLLPSNQGFSCASFCPSATQAVDVVEACSSLPDELRNAVAGADAAVAAQRGTANSISPGSFCTMQTPASVDSTWHSVAPGSKPKNVDTTTSSSFNPLHRQFVSTSSSPSQNSLTLPILKPLDATLSSTQPFPQRNFSHFSSPVAETRASLHAVTASSGPSSIERARQHHVQAVNSDKMSQAQFITIEDRRQPLASPSVLPGSGCGQTREACKGLNIADFNLVSSQVCNSAITAANRAVENLHVAELTVTSLSRGSGSTSDEKSGKDAATVLKRRGSGVDDSDCQSEDIEEATNSSKRSMKRSRAAELHNLCERKRRDRINEKLMALRDLMPNSSKTAKASILDEAIEYVKLLQAQLQAWSVRTGICIPQALIPSIGLQPLQMPAVPHMGLGMGMGMGVGLGMSLGMGMGLVDANAAAAVAASRTMLPLPPYTAQPSSLPSHAMGSLQPCIPVMAVVDGQERMQNPQILDPYNMHASHHQAQMQFAPMNMTMYRNMELYNAYVQGQQQQQRQWQHQQWQLMQQQQLQGNTCIKQTK